MKTLTISGVIVPSDYAFYDDLIEAGIVTPLASFAYAIAATNDDLEIVLNSYGGDVFAGNSISNAISRWAADHPDRKLFITVDAIALSAAAVILAKAPERATCRAYRESLIMYHSAASICWGGPGAMKDCAAMMDKVNNGIRDILLAKTDIPRETIDEWLSEGRMGWLTGTEAKAHGLVSKLLDGIPSEKPAKLTDEEAAKLDTPSIAASYRQLTDILTNHLKETTMNNEEDEKEKDKDLETEKQNTANANEDEDEKEKDKEEDAPAENEGDEDEDKDKEKDEEIENLKNQLAQLQARCEKAEKSLARLTSGLHNGAPAGASPKSFAEMVAAIPTNIPQAEWDDRFIALQKEHPAAFQRWMKR